MRCRAPPAFIQRGTAYCQCAHVRLPPPPPSPLRSLGLSSSRRNCFRQVLANRFARALEGAKTVSASGFEAYASPVPPPPPRKPDGPPPAPQGKVVVAFSGGVSSRCALTRLEVIRNDSLTHSSPAEPSSSSSVRPCSRTSTRPFRLPQLPPPGRPRQRRRARSMASQRRLLLPTARSSTSTRAALRARCVPLSLV